jgi:hypothetical protein
MTQRKFGPARLFRAAATTAHRTATPRDVPGSRLLPTHRAARLQSGSPPGVRFAQHAACLRSLPCTFLILQALDVSGLLVVVLEFWPRGVREYWSVAVQRQVRIAPATAVGDAVGHETIVALPPTRRYDNTTSMAASVLNPKNPTSFLG